MTQPSATVSSVSSVDVRSVVLPRAKWQAIETPDGRVAFRPMKGTWYGHVARGSKAHDVTVIAMIGCPACGKLLMLSHTPDAAKFLSGGSGLKVPVAHSIDYLGKVSPDIRCQHGSCGFHRTVYLDRWNKTKALFALAYVDERKAKKKIEIAYSHSIDTKEARFHLGAGKFRIIAGGPAIGFYVDERTGRMTAD